MPSESVINRCSMSGASLLGYYLRNLDQGSLDETEEHLCQCPRCRAKLVALELASAIHEAKETIAARELSGAP